MHGGPLERKYTSYCESSKSLEGDMVCTIEKRCVCTPI